MTDLSTALRYSRAAVARIVAYDDVDDVLQSAALVAWRKRAQFRGDAKYETWFCRIAINQALMHLRRLRSWGRGDRGQREIAVGIDFDSRLGPARTPEELAIEAERAEKLYEALLLLTPRRREAALRSMRGEKCGESGMSVESDKAARHKMREELRRRLA